MTPQRDRRSDAPGLPLAQLLTVGDQTDAAGRLLLEDSAPEKAVRRAAGAGVAMQTAECAYPDSPSRLGGTMNVSAWEALRQDTAAVLDGYAWLTGNYLRAHPTRRRTVQAFFDVSQMGITVPLLAFHRATDPVKAHRALPTWVASLFKASRGVFSAAVDFRNQAGPPFRRTSAAEIVTFAEEHGHFRRAETGRVCAAPARLIERAIDVLVTGEGGDPGRSGLGAVVDFDLLREFSRLQDRLGQALSDYRALLDQVTARVGTADPSTLFQALVPDGDRVRPLGDVTTDVVAGANEIQAALNALLGRRAGPSVSFPTLMAML